MPYYWLIRKSIAAGKSLVPYWVMIGLHALVAYWFSTADVGSNNDPAGAAMVAGFLPLVFFAVTAGLTFAACVLFLAIKRLDAVERDRHRWGG